MPLTIGTNSGALWAYAAVASHQRGMETAMARLASGKRINSAADDPAGVAIASRLNSEIRGTNQAIRNALDGQALLDTAEGAHKEVENILQRMREIAVQAANDTNNSQDRANLAEEIKALSTEIDRIASTTTWAGKSLMAVNNTEFSFQVGTATGPKNAITASTEAMTASALAITHSDVSLNDATASRATIAALDGAIQLVNSQRSNLGATSNRLGYAINNLTNVTTNLTEALGRIQDADFAAETTALAKHQILQKAAIAMLAQANASKQNILVLLRSLDRHR
jgi:flagellin